MTKELSLEEKLESQDLTLEEIQRIEKEIAEKYKNPKNVEQFGNEPIPDKLKTVKWYELFAIFASFFITPVHMMIPGTMVLANGLSFWGAVWSQTLGAMVAFAFAALYATVATKYGLPGAVASRLSLGSKVSRFIPSLLRATTSVILFATQTLGGGLFIQSLLRSATGQVYNLIVISIIFAIFQTIIAIVGFEGLKKVTRVIFPVKMIGMAYIAYALITSGLPEFNWTAVTTAPAASPGWSGFALSMSMSIGIFFTLITDSSDFCRYTRSKPDMWFGVVVGSGVSVFIAAFFGAYAAVAIKNWNIFEAMTHLNPSIPVIAFLILMVVLDNWSVNILNLYTAGLCLVNVVPQLGRFWWTVVAGVIASIASCFPVFITSAEVIILKFGLVFSPLVGVLIADLVLLKKYKLDITSLMKTQGRYSYSNGVNILAVIVVAIGCITFNFWPTEMLPALSNAVFSLVLYYVLVKILSPHWESLRIASIPFEEESIITNAKEKLSANV